MSFDFYTHFPCEEKEQIKNLAQNEKIKSIYSRIKIISKALGTENLKDIAKEAHKDLVHKTDKTDQKTDKTDQKDKDNPYSLYLQKEINLLDSLNLRNPLMPDLSSLPSCSFFLQLPIKLEKPYLSKDDDEFYPNENPIRKDKVFKVPMVSPSTWKGNLRRVICERCEPHEAARLLGHEKGEEDEKNLRQGRLFFYPTFFDKIDLEVINPHSRKTRAGTHPIYFECAPVNATGTFSLLYIPFDLIGRFEVEEEIKKEPFEDLQITLGAVKTMMLEHGFSAKKTSGFGVIKKDATGQIVVSGAKEPDSFDLTRDFTDIFNKVKAIWYSHGKET